MKKNRLVPVLGKFGQPLGKFLVVFCGDKPLRFERQTENFRPAMHEDFAILLVHSETDHVAFLQRAVLQINQDEKQAVGYAGRRAVLVDGRAETFPATTSPRHFILGQIVIMCSFKIKEKCTKLFMANTRQGTEAFGFVFIFDSYYKHACMRHI